MSDRQYSSYMAIRPELRSELLSLSAEDRRELADELYESLIVEPLDTAWAQEIEQRVEDIVARRVELIDAEEVHAELRAELRATRRP